MHKHMLTWGSVLMAAMIVTWVGLWVPLVLADSKKGPAPVPQTGQTECWDTNGTLINCSGTGQDGAIQAGVPFPTPRFTDNHNGTVTDNLTGLIWLKQDDCAGPVSWAQALTAANALASGSCGLTDRSVAGDWRLPNFRELLSLADYGFSTPALSNAAGTAPWTDGDAFSGSPSRGYWSSTTRDIQPSSAWLVEMNEGHAMPQDKGLPSTTCCWVWPVQGGK
jgi:hypothetical protein